MFVITVLILCLLDWLRLFFHYLMLRLFFYCFMFRLGMSWIVVGVRLLFHF